MPFGLKLRQRLLEGDIAQAFFDRVVAQARPRGLLSDEHFTVDGTLIEAWASLMLPDQAGKTHRLRDYAGRPLILYFYPEEPQALSIGYLEPATWRGVA